MERITTHTLASNRPLTNNCGNPYHGKTYGPAHGLLKADDIRRQIIPADWDRPLVVRRKAFREDIA